MLQLAGEESREIDAPAGAVWALRLDFRRLSEYNPDVSGVELVTAGSGPGGPQGAGATYRFALSTPGGSHPISLTVTGVVDGETVEASMHGAMDAREAFRVETLGDRRCRATLALWMDLPETLGPEVATAILANGRAQIRAELDAMAGLFAARA